MHNTDDYSTAYWKAKGLGIDVKQKGWRRRLEIIETRGTVSPELQQALDDLQLVKAEAKRLEDLIRRLQVTK